MNRRRFLGSSALGGVGLVASQAACARPAVAPAAAPPPATGNEPFELHEATIDELQAAMRVGPAHRAAPSPSCIWRASRR